MTADGTDPVAAAYCVSEGVLRFTAEADGTELLVVLSSKP
jgi:hypothetical protein